MDTRFRFFCSYIVQKIYFYTFQEKTSIVSLGDGSTCDVIDVGTVKTEMFDEVIRTLGGVVCVPDI